MKKNRPSLRQLVRGLWRAKRLVVPDTSKFELLTMLIVLTPFLYRTNDGKIFTHTTLEERLVLFFLADRLKPNAAVTEIGSFLGSSACYLARGLSGRGTLYCVDTWNNDAMDEPTRDTYTEFQNNTKDASSPIVPLRGLSHERAATFDKKIDLLFIDGDHSYDACLTDWRCWSKFLNSHAVVVFHDSGWAEGVQKVIGEEVSGRARREVHMHNMYVAWL